MKSLFVFFTMMFLSYYAEAICVYDSLIVPKRIDQIENDSIRQELLLILSGNVDKRLLIYKTKYYDNLIVTSYRNYTDAFEVDLSNLKNTCQNSKKICAAPLHKDSVLITDLRLYHMKAMWQYSSKALKAINEGYISKYTKQPFTCEARSYKSIYRLGKYLLLTIESGSKKINIIFIESSYEYCFCVVQEFD